MHVASGDLMVWGRNASGELGLGSTADRDTPTKVSRFPLGGTKNISYLCCNNASHIAAVMSLHTFATTITTFRVR